MSSLFKNKNKYFSCFNSINNNSFDIYAIKDGNINFLTDKQTKSNELKKYNYICDNEDKMILFKDELFKDKIEICEYKSLIRKTNFPIQSKFDDNELPLLDGIINDKTPFDEVNEVLQNLFNNENNRFCQIMNKEEIENILFFQPKNKI
jgi:hypothetical protein